MSTIEHGFAPDDGVVEQRPTAFPSPRGPLSEAVIAALRSGGTDAVPAAAAAALDATEDVRHDADLQLALLLLQWLSYGGVAGVDDRLEQDGALLGARIAIEDAFERELRATIPVPALPERTGAAVTAALLALTGEDDGPSTSRYIARSATLEQAREYLVHRSISTLQEADPYAFAIPRLSGRSKAALIEILSDEFGGGRPGRMHSAIFARSMRAAGLDDAVGAYLDAVPVVTLAAMNAVAMFGLHRRLRGAAVGHLAAVEMTSSIPMRFLGNGFRRLGFDADGTWYFDEHVEADAVHEQIAARDLAGGLADAQPDLAEEVVFGAAACLALEGAVGAHQLDAWKAGRSSLLTPLPATAA